VDSEINGTVLSATPRVTGTGKTVYDIAFSDGNTYATFDAKIWAKVQSVGQQPASARVSVKQNGQYTNFYLNDIAPQGQLPPPGVTLHAASQAAPQPQASNVPQAARPPQSGGMSAEDKARVTWLSCLSSAAQSVAGSGAGSIEILAVAQELYAATASGVYKQTEKQQAEPVAAANGAGDASDAIPW